LLVLLSFYPIHLNSDFPCLPHATYKVCCCSISMQKESNHNIYINGAKNIYKIQHIIYIESRIEYKPYYMFLNGTVERDRFRDIRSSFFARIIFWEYNKQYWEIMHPWYIHIVLELQPIDSNQKLDTKQPLAAQINFGFDEV